MPRNVPISDFEEPDPTPNELAQRKRIADRAELLRHVEFILGPPGWVYDEIEAAISHALDGNLEAEIESRYGHRYSAADLMERWELHDMLEIYGRAPNDSSYDRC